jgi:hypothetical protein
VLVCVAFIGAAQAQTLTRGKALHLGESIQSPNGLVRLSLEHQGNGGILKLERRWRHGGTQSLWSRRFAWRPGNAPFLRMQRDGNLVLRRGDGSAAWHSDTHNKDGSRMVVQDDGNLVVYDTRNRPVWHTGTHQAVVGNAARPSWRSDSLKAGQGLRPGESVLSKDGQYQLTLQYDGNLVLYHNLKTGKVARWNSGTHGRNVDLCSMQTDGNLVLYGPRDNAVWNTKTFKRGSRLTVQNDGNLVMYGPLDEVVWHIRR